MFQGSIHHGGERPPPMGRTSKREAREAGGPRTVSARAGNRETANIFYYLTNHPRHFQGFCSEFREPRPQGLSRHRWRLIKRMHRRGLLCHGVSLAGGKGGRGARAPTAARLHRPLPGFSSAQPSPRPRPPHTQPPWRPRWGPVASGPWETERGRRLWPPPTAWHSGSLCAHLHLIAAAPGRAVG